MKTANISDVTQDEFDSAVQMVISGIKASDPKLDTRLGTTLRSLLVNPEARIEATTTKQIEYVRTATSLKLMQEAESAGESVDAEDVSAIMSNFSLTPTSGTYAEGVVKISVIDGTQSYSVAEGIEFYTSEDLVFRAKTAVTAAVSGESSVLYKGASSYFFLVPVIADSVGSEYNIPQGTSLTSKASIYTFVSAEAYKSFNGGSAVENLETAIAKIPSGLSIRGFVNKNACEGMLRDKFDSGNYPLVACSTVGYGDEAQRRDKHNVFGVGVGGRIDLYVRNFGDLYTITKTVTGTKEEVLDSVTGSITQVNYRLTVTPDDFPGSCWVKSVSDIVDVNSSLEFSCTRLAVSTDSTWHDFYVKDSPAEAFNSMWQGLDVTVLETPPDIGESTSSSSDDVWSDERQFKVTVYCLPEAKELQNFVDRDDIRSVSTDVVVRCPIICNVSVSASAVYDTDNPIDEDAAKTKIRNYINSLGFVKSLTRSEIVHILKGCGAVSVDLSKQDMLYGTLHDANGKEYNLSGDALQLDGIASADAMLNSTTTVFAIEPDNIQLTLIPYE